MNLDKIIFGTYTLEDLLIAGGAIIVLLVIISIVKTLFKKETTDPHKQTVRCGSCGWKGQISRHAGRCPKCNQSLGDQKAKTGY